MPLLETLTSTFSNIYTDLTVAVVILLFGIVLGKILGKLALRLLTELGVNELLTKAAKVHLPLAELASSSITYLIYFVFIVLSLGRLGLNTLIFNILAAGIIATVVISILLAIKDIVPNIIAGLFIHLSDHIREGDHIKVNEIEGKVVLIQAVDTKLQTKEGDTIYLPNSFLTSHIIVKRRSEKPEPQEPAEKKEAK